MSNHADLIAITSVRIAIATDTGIREIARVYVDDAIFPFTKVKCTFSL